MAISPHSDVARPGWSGYVAAVVVSALAHVGLLTFALFVMPQWLHSATVDNPAMTVKIVDNIPAGDLGTHLPKLSGHNEPEQVARADIKPDQPNDNPPPLEATSPPPAKPDEDKSAVTLNSPGATPTSTPEPTPTAIPATPEPTATETPKKIAEPEPTAPPLQHREKVIVHNLPKAKKTPVMIAKAEKTPDVQQEFRELRQQLMKQRLAEAKKEAAEEDNDSDDDTDENETASASPSNGVRSSPRKTPVARVTASEPAPAVLANCRIFNICFIFVRCSKRSKMRGLFPVAPIP